MKDPTHIVINGNALYVSSNLIDIFKFIIGIEAEIDSFLSVVPKLDEIREQYLEMMDLVVHQAKLLKENSINYSFQFKEDPKTIGDKFKYNLPIRSQAVVLFAFLETLRVLWTAYQIESREETKLKDASNTAIDNFLKEFCLTNNNEWYKKNSKRSGKIGVQSLRDLRNNLTHFFAVSKLSLVPKFDEKCEKLSDDTNHLFQAISPDDLHEMIRSASKLMLEAWSSDCVNKTEEFERRITFVKKIVEEKGPYMMVENVPDPEKHD